MSFRNTALSLAQTAKSNTYLDYIFRYNPLYYGRAKAIFEEPATNFTRLLDRTIRLARKSSYGSNYTSRFSDWPILDKSTVLESPSVFRTKRVLSIAASTSGTTGQPMALWRSTENIAAEQAFLDWLISPYCPSMVDTRIAVLRAGIVKDVRDRSPPFGIYRNGRKRLLLSASHLNSDTINWYHNELVNFCPDLFWVQPTTLATILNLLEKSNLSFTVPTILSSSETMHSILRSAAEHEMQAHIIDYYGQAERACAAYSRDDNEFLFHPGYGMVELIPETTLQAGNDTHVARIIGTGYWNSAMPLIRYDTGDFALLPSNHDEGIRAEIATGARSFPGILGRNNDFLIGPNDSRIVGLTHIPRETKSVLRIQIIQKHLNAIEIRALTHGTLTTIDHQILSSNARKIIPDSMDVQITGNLPLITKPNGKTPFVIRNV